MPKVLLTPWKIKFIKANRLKMSGGDIAECMGVDKGVIQRYLKRNGLTPSKEIIQQFRTAALRGNTTSDKKTDRILKAKYLTVPIKRLADLIGRSDTFVDTRLRQLNLVIPRKIIEQRKMDSRIKPGNIPSNKGRKQIEYMSKEAIKRTAGTRFKKGQTPHNAIGFKDGDISVRVDHANREGNIYFYIRIARSKWIPLHQYLWELEYGKQPKGMCLWFMDGDSLNCELGNLELITRKENLLRNSAATNLTDRYVARTIVGKSGSHLIKDVMSQPELIKSKRALLKLNRTVKKIEHEEQIKRSE